jgi:hypothetical protein
MQITTVGLDLAKHWFQVHGVDATGKVVVRRRLRWSEVTAFFKELAPCLVGVEACATAHHWARELIALGHEVKLMPPACESLRCAPTARVASGGRFTRSDQKCRRGTPRLPDRTVASTCRLRGAHRNALALPQMVYQHIIWPTSPKVPES